MIGGDLRIGLKAFDAPEVMVMARPELSALYAVALRCAGRTPVELDGEQCFNNGIKQIAERIE